VTIVTRFFSIAGRIEEMKERKRREGKEQGFKERGIFGSCRVTGHGGVEVLS
jgi:hypothetical protein